MSTFTLTDSTNPAYTLSIATDGWTNDDEESRARLMLQNRLDDVDFAALNDTDAYGLSDSLCRACLEVRREACHRKFPRFDLREISVEITFADGRTVSGVA